MRRLIAPSVLFAALFVFLSPLFGGDYVLRNGNVFRGTIAAADDDGVIVKLDSGGFSKREPWINFSQDTLKQLAKDAKLKAYAEPFIDEPEDAPPPRPKKPDINVRDVDGRVERPAGRISLVAGLTTPAGLIILGALYAANLFAGFAVARYRNRPVALVCAASAVLPMLGPAAFLCLPTVTMTEGDGQAGEAMAAELVTNPLANPGGLPGVAGGGLSLANYEKSGSVAPQLKTYTRSDTQFTRKFFESTFPGFFRVVLGDAEKDLVLAIKAARSEYVAKRISRISATDVHLVTISGAEASVGFGEIASVTVRSKDAKG